jgi:hypothetical protein
MNGWNKKIIKDAKIIRTCVPLLRTVGVVET